MKLLDFFIQVGTFRSKGEAIRAIKNKITLKIKVTDAEQKEYKDIIIDESNINGDIFMDDGMIYITNFDTKKYLED